MSIVLHDTVQDSLWSVWWEDPGKAQLIDPAMQLMKDTTKDYCFSRAKFGRRGEMAKMLLTDDGMY